MRKFWTIAMPLCLLAVLGLCITLMPTKVSAATEGYYTYSVTDGRATITDVDTSISGAITIPSTLGGYPVTSIGYYAFSDCTKLTGVTIPNGFIRIGSSAFSGCRSLESVTIPNTVISIDTYAFYCTGLTSIIIPDSVTSIEYAAFRDCTSLSSVRLGKNITSIGDYAFYGCKYLYTVNYAGYRSDKGKIRIGGNNTPLINATWHYAICPGDHTYDDPCDTICNVCEQKRTAEHIYDNACDSTCNGCGESGRTPKHTYDNACDAICNVCLFQRTVGNHQYTINSGLSCATCKYSKVPEAPVLLSFTANSLTLVSQDGLEYSIDGVTWQDSPTFNNLAQGTQHNFYQRVKSSESALVSESSQALVINFTAKTIRYDANGGQNAPNSQVALVSATIVLSSSTPTREGYRFAGWATKESCGRQYAPGEQYLDERDVTFYALWQEACTTCQGMGNVAVSQACVCDNGKVKSENSECRSCGWTDCISVVTTGSGSYNYCRKCGGMNTGYFYTTTEKHGRCNGTGTISSSERCSDCAGSGIEDSQIPTPVISSFTDTTVVLQPLNGYEYSMDGVTWQESNVFANLSPATLYYFYCRVGATADAPFGLPSNGVYVRTDKSIQTQIPPSPMVESVTSSSITLFAVDGCEYSKDGTTWQASPSFTGLSVATKYTFYQRYKATTTTYAGKTSDVLVVKTDKGTQSQPSQPTLSSKNHRKVVLRSVYGCEYSKDGINWQSSPEFTELTPSTNYYFYIRKAETDFYYASDMSPALIVRTDDLPPYVPGDVDGDGEVSDWDGVMLARYLAGWDVEVEPAALDIDGDGEVTDWDGVILDRYLAGWNITIG